jgi:hypothetical protein
VSQVKHLQNQNQAVKKAVVPQRLERLCYGTSHVNNISLMRKMLTDDYLVREYEFPSSKYDTIPPLEHVMHFEGRRYELYYADVTKDPTKSFNKFINAKKVVAHYIQTQNLRELEESLADFGSLHPRKVWARRKLFLSTAARLGKGKCAVSQLAKDDISMHDQSYTTGCGFISERFLEELLGDNASAKRALGIQVRICIPTCGVFKGVLMRKRILDGAPVQLNESLQKVMKSRRIDADDVGWMVMNRVFPSDSNLQVGRLFSKKAEVTRSFKSDLKKGKECRFSDMHKSLMNGLGVPRNVLDEYEQSFKKDVKNLCHTHLVGVADPTGSLPPNTVFMTGQRGSLGVEELFVTRSPCLEPRDGRLIRLVTTKPAGMTVEDWDWLHSLHFGALVFANPNKGQRPLPELIADGDLDGDLYFVCWNQLLLSHVHPIPITDDDLQLAGEKTGANTSYDYDWFDKTQGFVSNSANIIGVSNLVGYLYKQSEEIAKKNTIKHVDAIAFAKAYKQALEFTKHGRKITLPDHLLQDVPAKFHNLLSSEEE